MGKWVVGQLGTDKKEWDVYHKKELVIIGIFDKKEKAEKYCADLNRKELGKVIKSWPDV